MQLAEMLGYADIAQLLRIAETYRLECDGHSKHELMQSILTAVGRRDQFEAMLERMSLEERRFLHSLLFDSRDAYSMEELLARIQGCRFADETRRGEPEVAAIRLEFESPAAPGGREKKRGKKSRKDAKRTDDAPNLRETIIRFKQYGWLFNGTNGTNRYLFRVPADLKERFRSLFAGRMASQLVYTDEPQAFRDEQGLLSDDVLVLLDYAARQPVPLTQDGVMYKRSLQQLLELLSVSEEWQGRGAWRFGYGRRFKDYPDRLALLYDYCHFKGYITEADGRLQVTGEGMCKLESRAGDEPADLYRFWLRLYRPAIPNLIPLVRLIARIADRWVTAASLRAVLIPFVRPFYYDDPEAVLDRRILAMMVHLGLLRIGEEGGGAVVRMTNAGIRMADGAASAEAEPLIFG